MEVVYTVYSFSMAVESLRGLEKHETFQSPRPNKEPIPLFEVPQGGDEVIVYTRDMADTHHDLPDRPRFTDEQFRTIDAEIRAQVTKDMAENPLKQTPYKPKRAVPPQFQAQHDAFQKETGLDPADHDTAYIHWLGKNADRFKPYKYDPAKHKAQLEQKTKSEARQLRDVRKGLKSIEGGKPAPAEPAPKTIARDTDTVDPAAS